MYKEKNTSKQAEYSQIGDSIFMPKKWEMLRSLPESWHLVSWLEREKEGEPE